MMVTVTSTMATIKTTTTLAAMVMMIVREDGAADVVGTITVTVTPCMSCHDYLMVAALTWSMVVALINAHIQ